MSARDVDGLVVRLQHHSIALRFLKRPAHWKSDAALSDEAAAMLAALKAENDGLRASVIAFGGPWAVQYAKDFGLAEGELHPTHYDILASAGGRMTDFRRAILGSVK